MLGQLKRRYSVKNFANRATARFNSKITSELRSSNQNEKSNSNLEPEIIIPQILNATVQCTDCNTRFSVPEEFANLDEELKFHCPRCNHVFCSRVLKLKKSDNNLVSFPEEQTDSNSSNSDRHVSGQQEDYDEEIEDTSEDTSEYDELEDDTNDFTDNTETSATFNKPSQSTSRPMGGALLSNIREQLSLRKELKAKQNYQAQENDFSTNTINNTSGASNQITMPFMFEMQTKKPKEINNSNIRRLLNSISTKASNESQNAPRDLSPKVSIEAFTHAENFRVSKQEMLINSLKRSLPLLAPALILVVGLFILSSTALYSSTIRSSLQKVLYPSAVKVAPLGLYIDDLKADALHLENGEEITLISGKIANHSAKTIKDINLEVLTFNSAGQLTEQTKARAGNTLTQAKIKTLTPEVIERIQNRGGKNTLKPGEEKTFELGLFENKQTAELAFFNTRIYSSRYN